MGKGQTNQGGVDGRTVASPAMERDQLDPGDETQRNFRYQHAYGVIILLGAVEGRLPYVAIWCEHHEDYLAERSDGKFDAYQIKTATPENGAWVWTKDALRDSIKRFVRLDKRFPDAISAFHFVSNVKVLDSRAENDIGRSPPRLLEALGGVLSPALETAFEDLCRYCACSKEELRSVLVRTELSTGPGRDSLDDELAQTHLPRHHACRTMYPAQLARCADVLVQIVYRASSLQVRDPARHWCGVDGSYRDDAILQAKRIPVSVIPKVLDEFASSPFRYSMPARRLQLGTGSKNLTVLEQKLIRAGLSEYLDLVRDRTVSAERHLIGLAHSQPDEFEAILDQLASVVAAECDEARLDAALEGEPYGQAMLSDVHGRLRRIARERATMVHRQEYEVLAGIAGLLTEECRVWWSERFAIEEVV